MNRIKPKTRKRVLRTQPLGGTQRRGLTMVELIVSAVLLMTVMTFVTSVIFRVNLIWAGVGHHRVAACELSNHMETLTLMTPDEAAAAIKSLEPSEACCQTLKSPTLDGEIVEDELGSRVTLRINWDRPNAGNPSELSGWIISARKPELDRGEPYLVEEALDDGEDADKPEEPDSEEETPAEESSATDKPSQPEDVQ